jgi:hypothetical protein
LGNRDDAQLFGQSRTLRIKQLLGLDCSMANLDLAAPSTTFCPIPRFSFPFAGLQAQPQPGSKIARDHAGLPDGAESSST